MGLWSLLPLCSEASFVQLLSNWVAYFVAFLTLPFCLPVTVTDTQDLGFKTSHKSTLTWAWWVSFLVGGVGAPDSLISGCERVSDFLQCISTLRQLNTRAALCYPRKEGEPLSWVQEELAEVGRFCSWFMKCRIGETFRRPDWNRKGYGGKEALKWKVWLLSVYFLRHSGLSVGAIGRDIQVLLYLIIDSGGESVQHLDSPTPSTLLFEHKKSPRLGSIMNLYCTLLLQGKVYVNFECSCNGLKFCHRRNQLVSNELLCLHDMYIDLFLWVLVRKKMLIAFQEFLCLAYGGVTLDEV